MPILLAFQDLVYQVLILYMVKILSVTEQLEICHPPVILDLLIYQINFSGQNNSYFNLQT